MRYDPAVLRRGAVRPVGMEERFMSDEQGASQMTDRSGESMPRNLRELIDRVGRKIDAVLERVWGEGE